MTGQTGTPAGIDQLAELRANRAIEKFTKKNRFTDIVERLQQHPSFGGCDHDDIVALICVGKRTAIPAQWAFVQEHTPADAAYVILDGEARVYRNGTPVADLRAGDIVGETGLLDGTLRNATVATLGPVKALRIDQDRFAEVIWQRPNLRAAFRHVADERLAAS